MTGPTKRDPVLAGIDSVRWSVSLWRMGRGYLTLCLVALALVFAGVLADHTFVLQRVGRLAFFRTLVFACGTGLLLATLYPVARRLGRLYVARKVEARRPALRNALISYVQVRDDPSVPAGAKALLARRAAPHLRGLDARVAIDLRTHLRLAVAVSVVLLAFLAYCVATPKSSLVSIARLLLPNADILPPTATRIVDVRPGDVYAVVGERPELQVVVRGVPPDQVYAVWSGASYARQRVLLAERQPQTWQGRFPAVLEDGTYYVVAGDTRTERYSVTLVPKPLIEAVELQIEPPAYTGLPVSVVQGGDLDVVRGSTVRVKARTSVPPTRGTVNFGPGSYTLLTCDRDERTMTGVFTVRQSGTYSIRFESAAYPGRDTLRNTSAIEYTIRCRADLAPVVIVHGPPDRAKAAPDDTVTVTYSVADDFGLTEVRLVHASGGFIRQPVVLAREPGPKLARVQWAWDLSTTGASPGQELAYYLEAEDNYLAAHHVGRSERRTILIVGEAPPPEPAEADARPPAPRTPLRAGEPPLVPPAGPADLDPQGAEPEQEGAEPEDEGADVEPAPNQAALKSPPAWEGADDREAAPADSGARALPAEDAERDAQGHQLCPQCGRQRCHGGPECPAGAGTTASDSKDGTLTHSVRWGTGASESQDGTGPFGWDSFAGTGVSEPGDPPGPYDRDSVGTGPSDSQSDSQDGTEARPADSGAPLDETGVGPPSVVAGPDESAAAGRHPGRAAEPDDSAEVADDAGREMLRDLGVSTEQLREYVERYKQRARVVVEAESQPRPLRPRGAAADARVLPAAGATSGLGVLGWEGPAPNPDDLRIRFEGARERLSPAYRDIVDRYFVALSEGL